MGNETGKAMKKNEHSAPNIVVSKDGPYVVSGGLPLGETHIVTNDDGESIEYEEGKNYQTPAQYALCRCAQSGNKPFKGTRR
jgi:CDGSH-type Zn-finger protein